MPPFSISSTYIVYIFFLTFLSQGQLITGTSKAWLGGFGEIGKPYSYTHPSTKQCNYNYTHPSTLQCTHTHTKSQITDFPTSLPASDVYSWAKAASKPTYTYSEVGAAAASHSHSGYATTAYVDSKVASVTETVYGGSFNTNNGHTFVTFSSTYAKLKIVFYQYVHSMPSAYTSLVDGTTRIIEKGGSINTIGFDTNYGYSYMTINFNGTKLIASNSGGGYSITYSLGIIAYTS